MKVKTLLLIPALFAISLTSCSSEGKRHDPLEYKAGEIVLEEGESFDILQLCDIHLSNKDNQQLQLDFISLTINDAINSGVDLIVLDGDSFTFADKTTAERLFNFLDGFGVHWTITFGNHDEQAYFSVTWLTEHLNNRNGLCIFKDIQDDDVNGNANFYIDIKDNKNKLFERVYLLDSNRYYFSEYMGYDYIKQNQIDWYKRIVEGTEFCESIAFFHIPLPEFEIAMKLYDNKQFDQVEYLGGSHGEGVSCPKNNSKFFDAILEMATTKAIFCGHDHENDLALKYKGIVLSYGTNSTDRIYSDSNMMGGQLITIEQDHQMTLTRIHHSYSEVEGK